MKINRSAERYQELDSLRGIASLMVVFFHFTLKRPQADLGFKLGTTGVDLFFIISGFVIFMSLNKISKGADFVVNRVSRLYPTYWACVTFTFILLSVFPYYENGILSARPGIINYLGNMTMFQFYLRMQNIDGPYWTMTIEMLFYIVMLMLYQSKKLKHLNKIFVVVCIATVVSSDLWYDSIIWVKRIVYWIPLLQYIPLFFAGTLFYRIYAGAVNRAQYYMLLAFCLLCQSLMYKYAGWEKDFISYSSYTIMLVIYFAAFTLFVNGKLKFIVNGTTLFLGKISFALYLIHQCISLHYMIPFLVDKLKLNFWVASICIALPVDILLASFITYFIEVPGSKKLKEKLRALFTKPTKVISA